MTTGVYKIMYGEKVAYVGVSVDVKRRKSQHFNRLRAKKHSNFILQRVFDKHGAGAFSFEIIEGCEQSVLAQREQHYIDLLCPFANISDARGSHPHTDEAKAKMRGRVLSDEHRQKMSAARKGRPSPRAGVPTGFVPSSAFKPGLVPWNKGTEGQMLAWNKGRHLSDSHREALKVAKLANVASLVGQVFGEWTVEEIAPSKSGNRAWKCRCSCGKVRDVMQGRLTKGQSSSCGHGNSPPVMRGPDHPMFGKTHTLEARAKIKAAREKQDMSSRRENG